MKRYKGVFAMTNETKTKNLKKKVEIDQESLHEMIEKIAYEIYEQREKSTGKIVMTGLKLRR